MGIDPDALARELRFLRKDQGVLHQNLLKRLGPEIKALCGINDQDGAGAARKKLLAAINELLQKEPREKRLLVLAALALHPEADQELLGEREAWLARQLGCKERTVRRRVNKAFDRLIELAVRRSEKAVAASCQRQGGGHYLKVLRAYLRLDRPGVELAEHRTVAFTSDGVSEIASRFSLPRPTVDEAVPHELSIDVTYGGTLAKLEQPSAMDFEFVIELPRAFMTGETHEYGLLFRIPPGQAMRPHYVVHPVSRCESLTVVINFEPTAPPRRVWRLGGVPLRVVDDPEPNTEEVQPDRLSQLQLSFVDLQQGLSYGVKWLP